jgi:hypothetical protein
VRQPLVRRATATPTQAPAARQPRVREEWTLVRPLVRPLVRLLVQPLVHVLAGNALRNDAGAAGSAFVPGSVF